MAEAAESFNPDQYLAEKTGGNNSFNPDQYLAEKTGSVANTQPTSFMDKQIPYIGGTPRGYARSALSTLPAIGAIGGGLVGSASGTALAPGPGTISGGLIGSGLGAAAGKNIENLGRKYLLNEDISPEQNAKDVAEAGIKAPMYEMGGQIIGKGLGAAADKLSEKAGEKAFKALGPYARDVKNQSIEDIAEKGQGLMKEGIVGGVPTSYRGLADRAEQALEDKGSQFNDMINNIGQNATNQISKADLATSITKEMSPNPDIPTLKNTRDQVEELLAQVKGGSESLSIPEAQKLKSEIGQVLDKRGVWSSIKRGGELNTENNFLVSYYHGLNKAVESAADEAASNMGSDVASQWKDLKQSYGLAKEAAKIASTRAGRELVNRSISPSDYMTSIGGAVLTGNPISAIALGTGNHMGRTFGNQIMAPALNKASSGAEALASSLQNNNLGGPVGLLGDEMNKRRKQNEAK